MPYHDLRTRLRNNPTYNFVLFAGFSILFLGMVYVYFVYNQFDLLDWIATVFWGFASAFSFKQYVRSRRYQQQRKERIEAEKERTW